MESYFLGWTRKNKQRNVLNRGGFLTAFFFERKDTERTKGKKYGPRT